MSTGKRVYSLNTYATLAKEVIEGKKTKEQIRDKYFKNNLFAFEIFLRVLADLMRLYTLFRTLNTSSYLNKYYILNLKELSTILLDVWKECNLIKNYEAFEKAKGKISYATKYKDVIKNYNLVVEKTDSLFDQAIKNSDYQTGAYLDYYKKQCDKILVESKDLIIKNDALLGAIMLGLL